MTKGLNPNVEMMDSGVEWIGKIPIYWEKSCVRYVTHEHRQGYYSSDSYTEDGLRVVRITDLNDDRTISIENSPFYQLSDLEKERFILKSGDFLFPRTGGVGRFGIFNDSTPSIYGSFLIRFRFSDKVVHKYMRYYFDSEIYLNQILSEIHGGVNQNVHVENIKDCKIFYPKKSEQHEIVSYLDEQTQLIDKTISVEEKRIELLKEYRQSLISEVVTGKIDVRLN
jgi:type I restriction enzyme S subunit